MLRRWSPTTDREATASELDEAIQPAEQAIAEHGELAALAHAALETKHEEQERLRRAYVHILRRMESTYRLAGCRSPRREGKEGKKNGKKDIKTQKPSVSSCLSCHAFCLSCYMK